MNIQDVSSSLEGVISSFDAPDVLVKPLDLTDREESFLSWRSKWLDPWGDKTNSVLELATKNLVYRYSVSAANQRFYIHLDSLLTQLLSTKELQINSTCILLDIVLSFSSKGFSDVSLAHILIEEIFDIYSIAWCQEFWHYLISREHLIASNLTGTRAPGTTLIRLCNSLLRRLSKNQDAHFSGQIAIFLARAFPLSEKSGLNIRGAFNVENITTYDGVDQIPNGTTANEEPSVELVAIDTPLNIETRNSSEPIINSDDDIKMKDSEPSEVTTDANEPKPSFYEKFWSLQSYFSDPLQLFAKPENLKEFQNNVKSVISQLKKNESTSNSRRDRDFNDSRKWAEENEDDEGVFVPKWLTHKDLFELQLKDVGFRRSILCQILIILDFLRGLTSEAKEKWKIMNASNKSIMYSAELGPEDSLIFSEIQDSILKSMYSSVDLEPTFTRSINTMVGRDHNWQEWKLRNCPSFERLPLDPASCQATAEKFITWKRPRPKFVHKMGTIALSKAWVTETGLEKLRDKARYTIPDAKEYYEQVQALEQNIEYLKNDPEATKIRKEFESSLETKSWLGLRAARNQGYWSKMGLVDKDRGFAGLFLPKEEPIKDETKPTEMERQSSKDDSKDLVKEQFGEENGLEESDKRDDNEENDSKELVEEVDGEANDTDFQTKHDDVNVPTEVNVKDVVMEESNVSSDPEVHAEDIIEVERKIEEQNYDIKGTDLEAKDESEDTEKVETDSSETKAVTAPQGDDDEGVVASPKLVVESGLTSITVESTIPTRRSSDEDEETSEAPEVKRQRISDIIN